MGKFFIEQRQCQMVLLQLLLDLQGGVVIGKQKFHSIEPGFSRCGEAFNKRHFGEHHG